MARTKPTRKPKAAGRSADRLSLRERLSLTSRNARTQVTIAIGLITVIPTLAVVYLGVTLAHGSWPTDTPSIVVASLAFASLLCGYLLLGRYPFNLTRLRRYLDQLVAGQFEGELHLLQGMADIPAIEKALQVLVQQLGREVERAENEMERVEAILMRRLGPSLDGRAEPRQHLVFRGDAERPGTLAACLGAERDIALMAETLDLLETCAAVYERDGSLVAGIAASEWSKLICEGAPRLFVCTGAAPAPEDRARCLQDVATACMEHDEPTEQPLADGSQGYAVPVRSQGDVVGALAFAFGGVPREAQAIAAAAAYYTLPADALAASAAREEPLPTLVSSLAKSRLLTLGRLVGESVERARAEAELRKHQDNLEASIRERTDELNRTNQQMRAEVAERRRAEALKDEFVSTVSHELRTPLAITKEGINLLIDGIPGDINDRQQRVLKSARGNIDRLARIINDLLDISKIEAGKMDMNKERIDFGTVCEHVATTMESLAEQKGLTLEAAVTARKRDVFADGDRLIQVITNLVSNAIKFTREGGVRIVVTNETDKTLSCAVEDTGVGLSEEDRARVFEKFTQVGRVDGAGDKGTGLGLSIARQIVELHRGTIRVESTLGSGSRFIFDLPLYSEQEVLREAIDTAIANARAAKEGFTLLLFELGSKTRRNVMERDRLLSEGMQRLFDMQNLVRATDRMVRRGDRQFVMLVKVTPSQLAGLVRRLKSQIDIGFKEIDDTLDVRLSCGYGEYPADGTTADELLGNADNTLSAIETIESA